MDWILKWYQVDNDGKTASDKLSEGSKATPLLLLNTEHRLVKNNTNKRLKELLLPLRSACRLVLLLLLL